MIDAVAPSTQDSPFRKAPLPALIWLAGLLAAFGLYWLDLRVSGAQSGLSINGHALWGRDFANLWSAGRLVIEGKTSLLYDVPAYQTWQTATLGPGIVEHNYSYPPTSLLYAPLFGSLPYAVGLILWLSFSLAAFVFAARPWLSRFGLRSGWAMALPATIVCLWAGHYGLLFAALWLAAWDWLDDHPEWAGVAIGLMLIKPHLAVLMPIVLVQRRAWRAMGVGALTVGSFVALSIAFFGVAPWRTYLASTAGLQLNLVGSSQMLWSYMMPTVAPALFATALPPWMIWSIQILIATLVIGLLVVRMPSDNHRASMLTAVATFLVLPYAFNYDLTIVAIAAMLLFVEAARSGDALRAWIAAASLALPSTMVYLAAMGVRLGPLVIGAQFAAMLTARPRRRPSEAFPPSPGSRPEFREA